MNHTDLKPHFRALDRLSLPGSRINEDGFGLYGPYAWILDGATGVSGNRLTPGPTDAAWLVRKIGDKLEELACASGPEDILRLLEADLTAAFAALGPLADDDRGPSACLAFLGLRRSREDGRLVLEGRFLGDVVALIPTEEGIVRWTDERAKPFEKRTLAALGGRGHEPGPIPEAVRRQILENRTKLNRPDGYWIVNPYRPWAGHELRYEASLAVGQPIVLATDGFMRLVDLFQVYTDASLHARLTLGEGGDLMKELRDLERNDPKAQAHPRVKAHDDATVLVIAAEFG